MSAVKLYELAEARDILDGFLAETEGEVTPVLQQLLDELEGDTKEKIERVALYVREQLATADAVKVEEQRLAARRKSLERAADGLKNYLKLQMERLELKKVDGLLCTVALQNNPPSVKGEVPSSELAELMDSAAQFVVYTPATYALNRRAVLDAHKAGSPIPDGLTIEQGTSLRIR